MRPKEPECQPKFKHPEHRDEIGFQINSLSHMIRWLTHQYNGEDGKPSGAGMYGWLIGFIYENRNENIYQRDLQQLFSVRRSTMTGILQNMERDGMLTRVPVEWDARLKKIQLTEKAIESQERIRQSIREIEQRVSSKLTPDEKQEFIRLCEKIREGIAHEKDSASKDKDREEVQKA